MSKHPEEVLPMVRSRKWKQRTWPMACAAAVAITGGCGAAAYLHMQPPPAPASELAGPGGDAQQPEVAEEASIQEALDAANAAAADADAAAAVYVGPEAGALPDDASELEYDIELWCEENNALLKTNALYVYKINSTARIWRVCQLEKGCAAPRPLAIGHVWDE
jgi:hypothetical protein